MDRQLTAILWFSLQCLFNLSNMEVLFFSWNKQLRKQIIHFVLLISWFQSVHLPANSCLLQINQCPSVALGVLIWYWKNSIPVSFAELVQALQEAGLPQLDIASAVCSTGARDSVLWGHQGFHQLHFTVEHQIFRRPRRRKGRVGLNSVMWIQAGRAFLFTTVL